MNFPYKPITDTEKRSILTQIFFSLQNKVTKVSEGSVISAVLAAVARIASKAEKDIAVYMARIFPNFAAGTHLDDAAETFGVVPRQTGSKASTYVRVFAQPATTYVAATHQFKSTDGQVFELLEDVTVGASGIAYVFVRAVVQGSVGNVNPLTITQVSPAPTGHLFCTNEVSATGGADLEGDNSLRSRILGMSDLLAIGTISYLQQLMIKFQPLVAKIYSNGLTPAGLIDIRILTWNGQLLSEPELILLQQQIAPYLSIRDSNHFSQSVHSVFLRNVEYFPVDIELRVQLSPQSDIEFIRRQMQSQISALMSPDNLLPGQVLQWEDLYLACRQVSGVNLIPMETFSWQTDYVLNEPKWPKLRGFILRDLSGVLLTGINSETNRLYKSQVDILFQKTVLI